MEMDEDDPMEIDDSIPATPIIERRSDEFATSNQSLDISQLHKTGDNLSTLDSSLSTRAAAASSNKDSDIVILDDDDDEDTMPRNKNKSKKKIDNTTTVKEIIDLVDTPKSKRCLNTNCKSKCEEFVSAPDFCISYFRVKKSKSNKEEICKDCYDQSVQDFDKLATNLKGGKLLFSVDFPVINETLQIDDSDEEAEEIEDTEYLDEENFKFISDNFTDILKETIDNLNLETHMNIERGLLKVECKNIETDCDELTTKVKEIRNMLDTIQINLYNQFRPDFRTLKGLNITDDFTQANAVVIRTDSTPESPRKSGRLHRPVNYVDFLDDAGNSNSPKVLTPPEKTAVVEVPKDLPVNLLIEKPAPKTGEIYYITRENTQASWIRARLLAIVPPGTPYKGQTYTMTYYKLVELKQQKERLLNGKNIAYMTACKAKLPVGTRVISAFKELALGGEVVKRPRNDPYYAGIVGENPVETNKYRYLIFFDIGYSQYVPHTGINLVFDASQNVWEDMPVDSQPFIKKYLESQDRPMVKLAKDQTLRVEYNGKWRLCHVTAVDCSLVKVSFEGMNRTEWIYRGSTRLSPMFREEQAATNRHTHGVRPSRKLGLNESATVVQYTRNNDFVQTAPDSNNTGVRAVARKSTTKPNTHVPPPNIVPFLPQVNSTITNTTGPTSKIMYFTPRDQAVTKRNYIPHECSAACRTYLTHNFVKLRGHNPLSKPLLCGWARMTLKDRGRKEIVYKAPCGRMIRNISEIHYYLRETESEMTVDLFDFNHMVRCLAEFSVECTPDPKDLSRGLEQVGIPVINGFNNDMLDFCNYSIKRVPMEGVHMNLEPEFLCGCDCDDDCIDKTKCACWKLTLEGVKYLGKDVDPISVGYIYRRLQEQVITGIYECNSRCKCNQTCLNRVVQNPLSLKLQVFKTNTRGWGIRSLNDIPQGTFICIYAGTLHTEQMANEDGMQYGDEYFAELDYIETVEKFKEDYEEDVEDEEPYRKSPVMEEEEEELQPNSQSKTGPGKRRYNYLEDNDFQPSINANISKNTPDSIRTRLRKRTKEDDDKKDKKPEEKSAIRIKQEAFENQQKDVRAIIESITCDIDTVTISDDEDEGREVLSFNPKANADLDDKSSKYNSIRELFGPYEKDNVYIMDAKNAGNIGRFLNHSCTPNVFVQNVFVDTHDLRFPWVAFFSSQFIRAGTELTWNYNYDIGSVPGRVMYCYCGSLNCKGRLL